MLADRISNMINGIRDLSVLASLGVSKRLTARVGALLKRNLAVSEALIESSLSSPPLNTFLLSSSLLESAGSISQKNIGKLCSSFDLDAELSLQVNQTGKLLLLTEEIEAAEIWGTDSSTSPSACQKTNTGNSKLVTTSGTTPAIAQHSGIPDLRLSADDIEKLKLQALTSADRNVAISALRQLAFVHLNADERGSIFLRALISPESEIRAEAARMLTSVGLSSEISEALVSLSISDDREKKLAIERLGISLLRSQTNTDGPDLALLATMIGLTSTLNEEHSISIRAKVLESLAGAAGILAAFPEQLADVIRHLCILLSSDFQTTSPHAWELLKALRQNTKAQLSELLLHELSSTRTSQARSFLISQVVYIAIDGTENLQTSKICKVITTELSSDNLEVSDRQTLGAALLRMPGDSAALAMLDSFPRIDIPGQRYILRLLSDIGRFREISDTTLERIGRLFLECLYGATKDLRLGVLETVLPSNSRLSSELRSKLAESYLDSFSDLVFKTDIELAENTLASMGVEVLPILLDRLEPGWAPQDRVRSCRILGEFARLANLNNRLNSETSADLLEVTRKVMALSIDEFPAPGTMAVTLGKLASSLRTNKGAHASIWNRIQDMQLSEEAKMEALSWVASSPASNIKLLEDTAKLLLNRLAQPEPDSLNTTTEKIQGTTRTLYLDEKASDYVAALPAIVKGLTRLALSEKATDDLHGETLLALTDRWNDLVKGRRIWGPAAATTVIESLGLLAASEKCSARSRLTVIRALGVKLADPPVMRVISQILAVDASSPELASVASRAALAILDLRGKLGRFPEEDRPDILWSLGRILSRSRLEISTARTSKLHERIIDAIFDGYIDNLPGIPRVIDELLASPNLPGELSKTISQRLAALTRLTRFVST
jgi:hypothetical protein